MARKEIEVTLEDQRRINQFAVTIGKQRECQLELEKVKIKCENLKDAETELMMLDQDDIDVGIPMRIGSIFAYFKEEQALEMIQKQRESAEEQISEKSGTILNYEAKLKILKQELYSKFGENINLDE